MELSVYLKLAMYTTELTKLKPFTLHQLRHGGASADALHGCTDLSIQERGGWASIKSVMRYRSSGKYLRALRRLIDQQVRLAHNSQREFIRKVKDILG